MSVNSGHIVTTIMTVFLLLVQKTTAASDEDGFCSVCDCLVNAMDTLGPIIDRKVQERLLALIPDIDECAEGTDNCDDNADCTNTDGSFTCQCRDGFEGDGGTCTDINECDTGADNCDDNADCTNTDGGFTCQCRAGFEGDGETCTVAWPDGTYTLLQAVDGCPTVSGPWAPGSRFQDTDNDPDEPNSVVPANIAEFLRIEVGDDITTHYCTKTTPGSSGVSWPRGSYCIARQGQSCQAGLRVGRIQWEDESSTRGNSNQGVVPTGFYSPITTLINFCCRDDGDPNVDIVLPPTEPFGLYRFSGTCQNVQGMNPPMEFLVTFQTEDDGNNDDICNLDYPDTTGCLDNEYDSDVNMLGIYVCYYNPL